MINIISKKNECKHKHRIHVEVYLLCLNEIFQLLQILIFLSSFPMMPSLGSCEEQPGGILLCPFYADFILPFKIYKLCMQQNIDPGVIFPPKS